MMPDPRDKWCKNFADSGDYAAFAGFEDDLMSYKPELHDAYVNMDIAQQLQLFDFVWGLLEEMKQP